jgi:hypothetical protein
METKRAYTGRDNGQSGDWSRILPRRFTRARVRWPFANEAARGENRDVRGICQLLIGDIQCGTVGGFLAHSAGKRNENFS